MISQGVFTTYMLAEHTLIDITSALLIKLTLNMSLKTLLLSCNGVGIRKSIPLI